MIEKRKYKKTQKFDPNEVGDLVSRARNEPTSGIYPYIDRLSEEEALEEILQRFSKLTDGLINICITGKVNTFHRYGIAFLNKWTSSKDYTNIGVALRRELGDRYPHEELYGICRIAIVEAVKRTKTNLSSTILTCLKDRLYPLCKNENNNLSSSFNEQLHDSSEEYFELSVDFKIQIEMLEDEDRFAVEDFLESGTPLNKELKKKLRDIFNG